MLATSPRSVLDLGLFLGGQLSLDCPAPADFDATLDRVLMIGAPGEAAHVWSREARAALFLSAVPHLREPQRPDAVAVAANPR